MIIRDGTVRPRVILVETHGFRGAPTKAVKEVLEGLGYFVSDLGFAEVEKMSECYENDIRVLLAVRI